MNRNFAIALTLTAISILIGVTGVIPVRAADTAAENPNPIRGFFVTSSGGFASISITTEYTEIQRLTLPAGKYIANASAQVGSASATPVAVQCTFMIRGVQRGEPAHATLAVTGENEKASLPLTLGFTLNERRPIAVACRTDGAGFVYSQPMAISAISVDRLAVTFGTGLN